MILSGSACLVCFFLSGFLAWVTAAAAAFDILAEMDRYTGNARSSPPVLSPRPMRQVCINCAQNILDWNPHTKCVRGSGFCPEGICDHWSSGAWDSFQHCVKIAETDRVARLGKDRASGLIVCTSMSDCYSGDCVSGHCECIEGFSGIYCDVYSPCHDLYFPCGEHGYCTEAQTCICSEGYYGAYCNEKYGTVTRK
ncbi:uncharacterized protein LOC102806330 [Saccoglossus kowalevskii]